MIYWERHNPRFLISLSNPRGLDYDVFRWDPEGWVDIMDTDENLEFSDPIHQSIVSPLIQNRFHAISNHPDHLVVYYPEGNGVCVCLIGSGDRALFEGLNMRPPEWWVPSENLSPLQRFEERCKILIEAITRHQDSSRGRLTYPTALETVVEGYCSRCGLTHEHHVSHEVPGFSSEVVASFKTPTEIRPYYTAFKAHYGEALKHLSDTDLLGMPLPPSKRHLRVLLSEVDRRITKPAEPVSAFDRLLLGGLLDE